MSSDKKEPIITTEIVEVPPQTVRVSDEFFAKLKKFQERQERKEKRKGKQRGGVRATNYVLHIKDPGGQLTVCGRRAAAVSCAGSHVSVEELCKTCARREGLCK